MIAFVGVSKKIKKTKHKIKQQTRHADANIIIINGKINSQNEEDLVFSIIIGSKLISFLLLDQSKNETIIVQTIPSKNNHIKGPKNK